MDNLQKMRHTLSHVLAAAVTEIYPDAKFGIGPAIDDGFYYDIDFGKNKVSDTDLAKLEKKMQKLIERKLTMHKVEVSREEALKWAKDTHQPLKQELIEDLPENEKITFYILADKNYKSGLIGDGVVFADLCKGPHIANTSKIGAFKLTRVAGAYWRGDEKRQMLTRIYGVAFAKKEELEDYMKRQQEAKDRDHRKLGKELDLFCYSELVGSGLPLFTPRGTILRDLLNQLSQSMRTRFGYQRVCIPHIANIDLYKTSGHYEKFPEMFQFVSQESGDHLALKPVSCPHHSQIYASQPRSYRDLPIKYLETTMVYRDEKKGELGGLSRVRAITQDDSHIFCTEDQVGDIFGELIESSRDLYHTLGMTLKLRLSFRDDKDGYIGTPEMWEKAETSIKKMADKLKMDYFIGKGEAAMYGPKMDFMAIDALGREWQLDTVQLDYALPSRFHLEYIDADGSRKTPVMVHCALLGSLERFMSVYLEHTAGWLPMWCAPENVRVLTVNDKVKDYVSRISSELDKIVLDEPLKDNKLRYSIDDSADSLGKKIKRATALRIPCIIIVGPQDAEKSQVSLRLRNSEEKIDLSSLNERIRQI